MTVSLKFAGGEAAVSSLGILVPYTSDLLALHFPGGDTAATTIDYSRKSSGGTIIGSPSFAASYMEAEGGTDPGALILDAADQPDITIAAVFRTEADWAGTAGGSPAIIGARGESGVYTLIQLNTTFRPRFQIYDNAIAANFITAGYVAQGTPTWEMVFGSITDDADGSGDGLMRLYMPGRAVNSTDAFAGPRSLAQSNISVGAVNGLPALSGEPKIAFAAAWGRSMSTAEMDEIYAWIKAWLGTNRGVTVT